MKSNNSFQLLQDKLEYWWTYSIDMLPNLGLAILVFFIFLFLARLVRKISTRFVLRVSSNASVASLISGMLYSAVIVAGIMSALDIMQLDKTVSSLLAGVGIVGLALGFAFQDLTANFISGAFIAIKRPFDVGHHVETNGFQGTIEEIELRATTLRTNTGLHVIIPNKEIFQKPIINYSKTDSRKAEFEFILPNMYNASTVQNLIVQAMNELGAEMNLKRIQVLFTSIETPNMRMQVSFWTDKTSPDEFLTARHEAIVRIHRALGSYGIYTIEESRSGDKSEPQKG